MRPLILASTSLYRRELLARLRIGFTIERPETDESPHDGESPAELASRLAAAKASAVAQRHPQAWALGSDQVAELDGQAIGKPDGREGAISQLQSMSGQSVTFHTAICLVTEGEPALQWLDATVVRFRTLSRDEVGRYVDAEKPYDCAGSFKAEGFGISLFDAIESRDPTALIGLPLIATARMLREAGFAVP